MILGIHSSPEKKFIIRKDFVVLNPEAIPCYEPHGEENVLGVPGGNEDNQRMAAPFIFAHKTPILPRLSGLFSYLSYFSIDFLLFFINTFCL